MTVRTDSLLVEPSGPGRRRGRRRRGDDGVALVEFTIAMPVLFMLIMGMFTGGMVMNRQMSLTHATREAARYGATVPADQFQNPADWAPYVRTVAVERSGGELAEQHVCVALMEDAKVVSSTSGSACIADSGSGQRVQVSAVLPGQEINGVLFSVPLTLTSDAVAKHER
jgi:Flp pilus assembly protein TadG